MWAMNDRPEQTAEGRLIGTAQKRLGLSGRQAAERASISEGRWRQIVNGYQTVRSGVHVAVDAPPDTLARMARVVGVTPEELEEANRGDAAGELRDLLRREDRPSGVSERHERNLAEITALLADDPVYAQAFLDALRARALADRKVLDRPEPDTGEGERAGTA